MPLGSISRISQTGAEGGEECWRALSRFRRGMTRRTRGGRSAHRRNAGELARPPLGITSRRPGRAVSRLAGGAARAWPTSVSGRGRSSSVTYSSGCWRTWRTGWCEVEPGRRRAGHDWPQRDPVSVLTEVLQRDGTVLSATETLRAELSGADHLGVLGSIWYDLARRAQRVRFEAALRQNLTAEDAAAALADRACTWLWRSLREAEGAGLDAGQVLQAAIASRSLYDARDIARVIDARVRQMLQHAVPQARRLVVAAAAGDGRPGPGQVHGRTRRRDG